MYWRDIYRHVEDPQLLSITGLHAPVILRKFLMTSMRDTRDMPRERTINQFLKVLESQFSAHIREREMFHLDEVMALKRDSAETVQSFWFRYEDLMHQLSDYNLVFPQNMMFLRMLKGLNISPAVRLSIITRLDCRNQSHTLENLRVVSTELLGVYRDVMGKPEGSVFTGVTGGSSEEELDSDQILVAAKKN